MSEQQQFAPDSSQVEPPKDDFWKKHKVKIIAAVAIPVAFIIAFLGIWQARQQMEEQATALYQKGASPEIWKSVVQKYPQSSRAADALLDLAADARGRGQYEQAIAYYRDFLKFKDHPVVPAAELAIAQCWEMAGKTSEARETYFKIAQNNRHPFFGPASIGLARIYKQQGNIPNARQTLTEFIAQGGSSKFISEAQFALAQLP